MVTGGRLGEARIGPKEQKNKEDQNGYHLIVLAKNLTGYRNLVKLVSNSWTDGFYYRPRTDRKDLQKYHEGLIVCSACIAGEVPAKIQKGDASGFTRDACDVNGDSSVNTADVVAIYTAIIGSEASGSPAFNHQIFRLLNQ